MTISYYGSFGGQFVPQILMPALHELEEAFEKCLTDEQFMAEYRGLLMDFLGRPTKNPRTVKVGRGVST